MLVTDDASTLYLAVPLNYRFELTNGAGAVVESAVVPSGNGSTSFAVTADLENEAPYQWRVRAEYQGTAGPWSAKAAFVAPVSEGYIRGSEIYDPLINGKTVDARRRAGHVHPGRRREARVAAKAISSRAAKPDRRW